MDNLNESTDAEKVENQDDKCILIFTCSYCGERIDTTKNNFEGKKELFFNQSMGNDDICPKCKHNFIKCSVCLCPMKLSKNNKNESIIFCTKCHHGGHYEHYAGWFEEFNECPNSKCNCRCQEEGYKNLLSNIIDDDD